MKHKDRTTRINNIARYLTSRNRYTNEELAAVMMLLDQIRIESSGSRLVSCHQSDSVLKKHSVKIALGLGAGESIKSTQQNWAYFLSPCILCSASDIGNTDCPTCSEYLAIATAKVRDEISLQRISDLAYAEQDNDGVVDWMPGRQ